MFSSWTVSRGPHRTRGGLELLLHTWSSWLCTPACSPQESSSLSMCDGSRAFSHHPLLCISGFSRNQSTHQSTDVLPAFSTVLVLYCCITNHCKTRRLEAATTFVQLLNLPFGLSREGSSLPCSLSWGCRSGAGGPLSRVTHAPGWRLAVAGG